MEEHNDMSSSPEKMSGGPQEGKEKSGLKRKLLIFSFVLDFFIVIGLIYYFAIFPRQEIEALESSHVAVSVDKDLNANYTITKKRPANWVSLKEMNYTAAHAIVVSEDWSFYGHSGYDLGQIKKAAVEAVEGERTRGASTISQQVVKNLFLNPEKTLTRKFKELIYSTYMERNVSKEKILETYLNIAEFGPGIYGIKAASRHYFKKGPKDLTAKEGAFLAMLLPSPKRYGESFRKGEMTDFAQKTVDDILEKMVVAKYIKKDQLERIKGQRFGWESSDASGGSAGMGSGADREERAASDQGSLGKDGTSASSKKVAKKSSSKKRRKRKKKDLTGKGIESKMGIDEQLKLEENPEFDEDALVEDVDGLEAEFNVQ
jgi:monofunctional biosynthetic peptidoglycan transglycosylase